MAKDATEERAKELWAEYWKSPTEDARNELIEHYMPLVRYHAEQLWARLPSEIEWDDLVTPGVFGLMDAIKKYDPKRAASFVTYSRLRITGAMFDEIRQLDWAPRLVRIQQKKQWTAISKLKRDLGRNPDDAELAECLGVDLVELPKTLRELQWVTISSLDQELESDRDKTICRHTLDEGIDHQAPDPSSRLQEIDVVKLVVKGLKQREKLLIIMRYYEGMSMKKIGESLNISEARVSQLHERLMRQISERLAERKQEFLP